ncbi:MAG: signal peptidase I [Lachnospiraceae bacterium]|nr:signal peptidase I [Lachnospiraceae bacterium]
MKKNAGLSFYEPEKKNHFPVISEIFLCLIIALIAVFMAVVSVYFFGLKSSVVGTSMEPGLSNGQDILINRFAYTLFVPKKGDVVVFLPHGNEHSHYYVKRVVAIPGDIVQIRDGKLYVNGEASPLVSEYISYAGIAENEFTLKNGQYFCMGDNPDDGEDSRQANIGPVDKEDIIGRAWWHMKSEHDKMGLIK